MCLTSARPRCCARSTRPTRRTSGRFLHSWKRRGSPPKRRANSMRSLARSARRAKRWRCSPIFPSPLRAHDINTEVYLERAKIGKQFEYANKKGFRVAITAGADEFSRGTVKVKDLSAQAESDVPLDQVAARVKTLLDPKAD